MPNKKKTEKFIAEFDAKLLKPVNALIKKYGYEKVNLLLFGIAGSELIDGGMSESVLTAIFKHDVLDQELPITKPDIDFLHDKRWLALECSCCDNMRARKTMKYCLQVSGGDDCGGEYFNVHSTCKGCQSHHDQNELYTESALKKFVADTYKKGAA